MTTREEVARVCATLRPLVPDGTDVSWMFISNNPKRSPSFFTACGKFDPTAGLFLNGNGTEVLAWRPSGIPWNYQLTTALDDGSTFRNQQTWLKLEDGRKYLFADLLARSKEGVVPAPLTLRLPGN